MDQRLQFALDRAGGPAALARAMKVPTSAIARWRKAGIEPGYWSDMEKLFGAPPALPRLPRLLRLLLRHPQRQRPRSAKRLTKLGSVTGVRWRIWRRLGRRVKRRTSLLG